MDTVDTVGTVDTVHLHNIALTHLEDHTDSLGASLMLNQERLRLTHEGAALGAAVANKR